MKRFCLLALLVLLITPRPAHAQIPLGGVAKSLPINASRLLADPLRNRVYAAVPAINSVEVIDTTTLTVTSTIAVGSDPVDMAISPDGNTLYVANNGSTLAAIAVVDLNALTLTASLPLSTPPVAIAAGLGGRLYVSASPDNFSTAIYQLDSTTGAVQTSFNAGYYDNNLLALTPDGTKLFEANNSEEPGDLKSFDVSTATPAALQVDSQVSTFPPQLVISHNGKYLCLPSYSQATLLYSTADITSHYGSFVNSTTNGSGPLAFSLDDSLVYESSGTTLEVFSTVSFTETTSVTLPTFGSSSYPGTIKQMIIDGTGSYLFIGGNSFDGTTTTGQVVVVTTGAGTLTPPSVLPAITSSLSTTGTEGMPFTYQITASGTPTSYDATNLPDGLSVDTTTGLISGTPTGNGYFFVMISASNASGAATASLSIEISYGSSNTLPVVTTTALPNGAVGQAYSATVTASNSPYYFGASGLPNGLSIDSTTGIISGTPTAGGIFYVDITVENNYGYGSATLSLIVTGSAAAAPVITSAANASGAVGAAFSYQVVATNSPTGYTATGLPAGLSISAKTGRISGAPSAAGQFAVILGATNAVGTTNAALLLTISGTTVTAPVVSGGTVAGTMDVPFTYQIVATNAPTGYGIASNNLPTGLTLNAVSGLISGTPTVAGTFNLTLTASNAGGMGQGALTLTIAANTPPVLSQAATASGTLNQAFSYQLTASGDPTSFDASPLPSGLNIDKATGLITGMPAVAGFFTVNVSAANAAGNGFGTLLLTIISPLPTIDVVATVARVTAGSGDHAAITISRTGGDLSQKLTVAYSVKGSARNGTDYFTISGKQKIKPNKVSTTIQIIPIGTLSGDGTRVVKVTLLPAVTYQFGTATTAKVKIVPANP